MHRPMCLALVAAAAMAAAIAPAAAEAKKERVVNVYNWSDYIGPTIIEDFTKETGITVRYDTFDSSDTLETKLLAGKSGYDVVVPTAYFLERQIKAGIFQKLDKAKLPNLANVWPEIAQRLAKYDVGNQYAVNYMWGTTGIGYNVKKVRDALGADVRIDSWDFGFKPERLAKLKACGEICFVVGFSGDIKQAQKRAAEAKNGVDIAYAIPKEGAQLWFDNLAVPRDSRNADEAHAFINYLQKPEVAAKNSNLISYANGNLASQRLIDKEILEDPTIYPDAATMSRLYTIKVYDAATQRLMNRLWTRIKTGR